MNALLNRREKSMEKPYTYDNINNNNNNKILLLFYFLFSFNLFITHQQAIGVGPIKARSFAYKHDNNYTLLLYIIISLIGHKLKRLDKLIPSLLKCVRMNLMLCFNYIDLIVKLITKLFDNWIDIANTNLITYTKSNTKFIY